MEIIKDILNDLSIIDKGQITDRNYSYFSFVKYPRSVRNKKSNFQVVALICFFIAGGIIPNDNATYLFWGIAALIGIWHTIGNRYYYYYRLAANQSYFSRYKQSMRYIMKLVNSKFLYSSEMPLVYYIFKAKQLLLQNEYAPAAYINDVAMKEYKVTIETKMIEAICLYLDGNLEFAMQCFQEVSKHIGDSKLKKYAEQMCNII
ncbi:MAG: hypothetical protein ACOWWR_08490 [Eubacteriales bacterium]